MTTSKKKYSSSPSNTPSVWSVDRIGRLIVGILNLLLLLAVVYISAYFLIGLCFVNLNLIFTSLTDHCPMRNFLKRLGAKEREKFYNENGELVQRNNNQTFSNEISEYKNI